MYLQIASASSRFDPPLKMVSALIMGKASVDLRDPGVPCQGRDCENPPWTQIDRDVAPRPWRRARLSTPERAHGRLLPRKEAPCAWSSFSLRLFWLRPAARACRRLTCPS